MIEYLFYLTKNATSDSPQFNNIKQITNNKQREIHHSFHLVVDIFVVLIKNETPDLKQFKQYQINTSANHDKYTIRFTM